MIANCVHANIGISVHVWTSIYFSLNCSTLAVESDENRILKRSKSKVFWKIRRVFSNKNLEVSRIATCGKFLECLSNGFFPKNRKTCWWDLFTLVERAVAWIYRNYDANLIFIRSFSQKCVFTLFWGSFGWKSKIITVLDKQKIERKNRVNWKKKRFHPSEKLL